MSSAKSQFPIAVTYERGARFRIQIRSHTLVVDQPERGGGEDSGPEPIELLGAALASCVALYVQRFCSARGISTDGLRIEVDQRAGDNPRRVTHFDVHVILGEPLPEHYAAMLERVVRSCPAHNTLVHGAAVSVDTRIEALATA